MSRIETFHIGGFIPAAPQQNRAERIDSSTGFTRWDVAGAQVEQRVLSAAESIALQTADASKISIDNGATLKTKAQQALAANATFLAIPTPTAAQNAAQAKALTRQVNGLIRLALGRLDDVSDT